MKTALLSLLGAAALLLTTQCTSTPEQEAPTKYKSTPSARRAIEREPAAPRNLDSLNTTPPDSTP
ncbi:hypothetical protein GCM10011375_23930 [Hymenobacter qilianensis]|uniref:Uncharacterized protein n=2 Tax=Hymenobacter qilianensis TaxID=1385715 RepID=A0ACB5PSP6_9BACT|nr:hypothetical protein [Hymenobacter qilianensis]QNP52485.1 hypothetical protein H9L05_01500 [Hymenobacter qilianensis]GGF68098.1 hypothetical protein GCM10011375_23930 [Hymenobacter qilianensis]